MLFILERGSLYLVCSVCRLARRAHCRSAILIFSHCTLLTDILLAAEPALVVYSIDDLINTNLTNTLTFLFYLGLHVGCFLLWGMGCIL